MNDTYRGLRVINSKNPKIINDRPAVSGTVKGCNGMGSAYIKWDDGSETLTPLNETETYGQYDSSRISEPSTVDAIVELLTPDPWGQAAQK
jgi:hypothetical protein